MSFRSSCYQQVRDDDRLTVVIRSVLLLDHSHIGVVVDVDNRAISQ